MTDVIWKWDPGKAEINRSKHGLSFETACLVFNDPCLLSDLDPFEAELRWRTLGTVMGIVLFDTHRAGRVIERYPAIRQDHQCKKGDAG